MPTLYKPKKTTNYQCRKQGDTALIQKIYNSTQWKKLRKAYLMEHPLCEVCQQEGHVTPAVEIHHIRSISSGNDELEMKDIAYNPYNLMALCEYHHHEIHNEDRKQRRTKVDK